MPKKKKDDAIVGHTASDERSTSIAPSGDESLDEVLAEPNVGAAEGGGDIESLIGEDAEVEAAAKLEDKFADEIAAEDRTDSVVNEMPPVEEAVVVEKKPKRKVVSKVAVVQQSRAPRHGKKYRDITKDIDLQKSYAKKEAIELVKKTSFVSFDATVEVHITLSMQNQRGVISLPSGSGKQKRVVAATTATIEDLVKQIEAGKLDFDVLLATPDVMPKLSKVAKILGPRGLMPNPKSGTITTDIEQATKEFGSGKVEYKQDKGGAIHLAIGKISMSEDQLLQNLDALLSVLPMPKITSIVLSSTMGPGIKVSV